MTFRYLIAAIIGFGLGNFLWQALTTQAWDRAHERTFFQAGALMLVYVQMKFAPFSTKD